MTDSLDDDVLAIYRHKRGRKKNIVLKVDEVVRLVAHARWKRLCPSDKIQTFCLGASVAPSPEEVYDAIHRLMDTHPHFFSLSGKNGHRHRHNSRDYLHLVHSA